MSSVTLRIATDSLRSLPSGASYSDRSGQASVHVGRTAATLTDPEYIYVYASCDSLQLQCDRYERQLRTLRREFGAHESEVRSLEAAMASQHTERLDEPPDGVLTSLKWYFYGLLSGVIVSVIVFINIKKREKNYGSTQ